MILLAGLIGLAVGLILGFVVVALVVGYMEP